MEKLKPLLDIVSMVANLFTIMASGLALYLFIVKRKELSLALNLLLNYSFQTTLTELKEKLERLNEYNANEPTDLPEIKNILHEIAGQLRGNQRLLRGAPELPERIEKLARNKRLSEPLKRSMVSELREYLRGIQINSIESFAGNRDE